MIDWATILIAATAFLGGVMLYYWGYHFGFKDGQEHERDIVAQRTIRHNRERFSL